jgi:hypothetical protein
VSEDMKQISWACVAFFSIVHEDIVYIDDKFEHGMCELWKVSENVEHGLSWDS